MNEPNSKGKTVRASVRSPWKVALSVLGEVLFCILLSPVVVVVTPESQDWSEVHASLPVEDLKQIARATRLESFFLAGRSIRRLDFWQFRSSLEMYYRQELSWAGDQHLNTIYAEANVWKGPDENGEYWTENYSLFQLVKTNGVWRATPDYASRREELWLKRFEN